MGTQDNYDLRLPGLGEEPSGTPRDLEPTKIRPNSRQDSCETSAATCRCGFPGRQPHPSAHIHNGRPSRNLFIITT